MNDRPSPKDEEHRVVPLRTPPRQVTCQKETLEVRRATAPYFRPWVVVVKETRKVLAHCHSRAEAEATIRRIQRDGRPVEPSDIQPSRDPMEVHRQRMENPFGEPQSEEPVHKYGEKPKRTIVI